MKLKWIDLDRFRNLGNQKTELHPRYNLLLGPNGQGKTNFLEAVGYLGSLRSIRSAGRREMIRSNENMARITGSVMSESLTRTLTVALTSRNRTQFLDEKRITSPEEYLQALNVVHFIPEDVGLISGAPSWRRKVVDRAVFETNPGYVTEYRRYLLVLRQRNALLRRGGATAEELISWNSSIASCGAVLVVRRKNLINEINRAMGEFGDLLGLGKGLGLDYIASYQDEKSCSESGTSLLRTDSENTRFQDPDIDAIKNSIHSGLDALAERETRSGHTLVGPHRDKIVFALKKDGENIDLARFGSQGQKRSSVLAFKMALAVNLHREKGVWPLILLDDVASELDASRREALGRIIRRTGAQFFISTTGEEYMFLPAEEGKIFKVMEGRLEPYETSEQRKRKSVN